MLQDESTAGPRLRPMRAFIVAIAAAAAAPFIAPAAAEPVFDCSGTNKPMYETVCGAQELRDLGGEIDTELARLLRGADPLSAMLLKRDQIWFREILAAENTSAFHGQQDTVYARLLAVLKVRRHALARLRTGSVTTPAGSWSNAFAAATVGKAAGDALTITLQARLSYANENRGEVACAATATAALGKDGWYSATIGDKKDDKGNFDVIRFRLQGNTLRVVHETNHEVAVCTGSELSSDDSSRQAGADVLTGTFFAAGPAASANGSAGAPMIAPSFPCATAENADEQEICADPDLALADVEIARLYRQTIRRLDRKLTAQLRADQRAWASENAVDYLVNLQPGSDKAQSSVHHTSAARSQLSLRQNERILLLANLDETRKGLTGLWLGHNGSLTLGPAKGNSDGTMHGAGAKWDVEDYKTHCDFASDGRIENGAFKAVDEFPTLTRDGGTLVVAAEDPDKESDFFDKDGNLKREQPDYCWRLRSPKMRLFPVKPGSGIEAISSRLR